MSADIDASLDYQWAIVDVFEFGRDSSDGFDHLSEEFRVMSDQYIGIMPKEKSLPHHGGSCVSLVAGSKNRSQPFGSVDGSGQGFGRDKPFELSTKPFKVEDASPMKHAYLGACLGTEKLSQ